MIEGSYIVANETDTCVFSMQESWADIQVKLVPFGVSPAALEDLTLLSVEERRDLLVGKVMDNKLRFQAVELGLEPVCSTIIHRVVTQFDLDGCWRQRADEGYDTIETPRAEITGVLPTIVYHGTAECFLDGILEHGLLTDREANWENGGRDHVYLAAEAQVSAFHARKTAAEKQSQPIVLKCAMPAHWVADHDVDHQLVRNPAVPSNDATFLAQEAGLFAAPNPLPASDILEIRRPVLHTRFATWPVIWSA